LEFHFAIYFETYLIVKNLIRYFVFSDNMTNCLGLSYLWLKKKIIY